MPSHDFWSHSNDINRQRTSSRSSTGNEDGKTRVFYTGAKLSFNEREIRDEQNFKIDRMFELTYLLYYAVLPYIV